MHVAVNIRFLIVLQLVLAYTKLSPIKTSSDSGATVKRNFILAKDRNSVDYGASFFAASDAIHPATQPTYSLGNWTSPSFTTPAYPYITTYHPPPTAHTQINQQPNARRLKLWVKHPKRSKDEGKIFTPLTRLHAPQRNSKAPSSVVAMDTSHRWVPISIEESEEQSAEKYSHKLDVKKLVIMLLFKFAVIKLKTFAALKTLFFLILKFKLALTVLFLKFLLFLKALKSLKKLLLSLLLPLILIPLLLIIPMLLAALAPLLLGLLPLLSALPIPLPVEKVNFKRLTRKEDEGDGQQNSAMHNLSQSQSCVEKMACELATKKDFQILVPFINWYLGKLKIIITNKKILSYISIFQKSVKEYNKNKKNKVEFDGRQWCHRKFDCSRKKNN